MTRIIRTYDIDEGEASTIEHIVFNGSTFDPVTLDGALHGTDTGFEILNDVPVFQDMDALVAHVNPEFSPPVELEGCKLCGGEITEIQPERARAAKRVYFDVLHLLGFESGYQLCWPCWDGIVDQFLADEEPEEKKT